MENCITTVTLLAQDLAKRFLCFLFIYPYINSPENALKNMKTELFTKITSNYIGTRTATLNLAPAKKPA